MKLGNVQTTNEILLMSDKEVGVIYSLTRITIDLVSNAYNGCAGEEILKR